MNRLTRSAAGLIIALLALSFSGCDDDSDVIGLNDATKYGYIKLTFDGSRPDGVDLKVTKNYKFMTGSGPASSSTVNIIEDGTTYYDFHVTRLFDAFDATANAATINLNAREDNGELIVEDASVAARNALVFKDKTAFNLNISFGEIAPEDITSFTYNEETGKLVIKFTTVVSADWNNSGSDLTVTGEVRVTVYQSLNIVG